MPANNSSIRETLKDYLAVVRGHVSAPGCIGKPLPKGMTGPVKLARTEYALGCLRIGLPRSATPRPASAVRCFPHTGRYHQIRYFRHFRHPVMGDSTW